MPVGASVILSWENPTDLWNPAAHTCQVWRQIGQSQAVLAGDDVCWGFFCDLENGDPSASYNIIYLDGNGGQLFVLLNVDIEKYIRPANICEITFCRTSQIGNPDAGREIEISDEAGGSGEWRKNVVTSSQGLAVLYLVPNTRLLMRIEGDMKALDFVVPDVRSINYEQLCQYGTFVDTDPRRAIGWEQ